MEELYDLTQEREVVVLMDSSTTDKEWNANVAKVKAANGNCYPSFWYKAIIASGMIERHGGQMRIITDF